MTTAGTKPVRLKHEAALHSLAVEPRSSVPRPMEWRCLCGWVRAVNGFEDRHAAELDAEAHVRGLAS